eukprot:scpid39628/ scgid18391/ 
MGPKPLYTAAPLITAVAILGLLVFSTQAAANFRQIDEPVVDVHASSSEDEAGAATLGHAGMADLPPLLEFANGTAVKTLADWQERRAEMGRLLTEHYYGSFPTEPPPELLSSELVNVSRNRGVARYHARLTFNTHPQAQIVVEILVPEHCTNSTPCPAFMTQTNHRKWASVGVSRGYAAFVYPGADSNDQTDVFRMAYPAATWGLIARRAWLASRVVDYVMTCAWIEHAHIAITGHSRNGKQSMIAAAFDQRITAVIDSSSGAPAMSPYRFTSAYTFSEDPYGTWPNAPPGVNCSCTRNPTDPRPKSGKCCWWLPSVMNLSGFENSVPIDSHALLGLIAPRSFLSQTAFNDPCDPSFAVERAYLAGKKAYKFLGKPDNIRIRWRPGGHHGFEMLDSYFDWFDLSFGRYPAAHRGVNDVFPEQLIHAFNWTEWNSSETTMHTASPPPASAALIDRVNWMTGIADQPVGLAWSPAGSYSVSYQPYVEEMLYRQNELHTVFEGTAKMTISFGRALIGTLYFPANASAKSAPLPGIVWLHPYSYQQGYTESYPKDPHRMPWLLAQQSNAVVLAFDQIGFGRRLREGRPSEFYSRWPNWSLLGHMIQDVQSAVDALLSPRDAADCPDGEPLSALYLATTVPRVERVTVVGYAMGAIVALHSAVLDTRIAAVAACTGISPWKQQALARETGGNARLYEWHALLPRLGWFQGREAEELAYDYDDLLVALRDRPTLLYNSEIDRQVDQTAFSKMVSSAAARVQNKWKLKLHSGAEFSNKLDANMQTTVTEWINSLDFS